MLDFTLPSMPSRVPPRAAAPAVVDRASAEADAVDAGDESFASTLDALADDINDQAEASDASAEEDSVTSPIVPATAPLPDAIQPVVVPGWMVALRGDLPQEDAGTADGAATPDAGTSVTGEVVGHDTSGLGTAPSSIPTTELVSLTRSGVGTAAPQATPATTTPDATAPDATMPEPAPLMPKGTASASGAAVTPAASFISATDPTAAVDGEATATGDPNAAHQSNFGVRAATLAAAEAAAEAVNIQGETRASTGPLQAPATPSAPAFHLSVESEPEAPAAERRVPAASLAAFFQESAAVAAPREGALSFEFSGRGGESPVLAAQVKTSSAAFATALANTPAFDALPAETTAQIVQAMRLQMTRGGGEAHIKLEPHHFGDLKVSIKVEQGQVTARLEAEVPVVREWLQSNQALLRTSLAEQNLMLDRLEVAEPRDTRDSEERQQHKEERPKPQSSRRRRSETRDVFEVVA